jgi:hypothetical protein
VCSGSRAYYGKSKADALRKSVDASDYLAAMKESGDVDYAAAVVLFLDVSEPENGSRIARIAVAKSRHGETGFAGARFYGATGRWESDTMAAIAMMPDARDERRREIAEKESDARVLEMVREHGPCVWRDIRPLCGTGAEADRAKSRLILSGALEEFQDSGLDAIGRTYKRKVLQIPGHRAPEPKPLGDVGSHIKSMLGGAR